MNSARALFVIAVIFAGFIMLGIKLYSIQIIQHDHFSAVAENQQNKSFKIRAERGVIKDRNGDMLAFTRNDISLYVDKRMLDKENKDADSIAKYLSKIFNKPESHYLSLIKKGRNNVSLEKKVSKENLLQATDKYLTGFFVTEDFSRIYPYGSLCSHVLGYVDLNCKGIYGIEKQFDEYLSGKDGRKFIENDGMGRKITVDDDNTVKPVPGSEISLTINKTYQTILEQELSAGMVRFKGDSVTGIIMNPNTGEILALSSMPDFDPSYPSKFELNLRRNRAITDPYEPGSIIKPIIMAMMIEKGLVNDHEMINTENGNYAIRSTKIYDTHAHDYLNIRGIIEQSSNIGMTKLSARIDESDFYKYLRDFGFGNPTSVELPGESEGTLKKPGDYSKLSKAFMSFGYEIAATPLQLITAFSALVNGGRLMEPYIIKEVRDNKGQTLVSRTPRKIRDVISQRSSDKIIDLMIGVVEEGTAINAKMEDVKVGGKTGTAQMLIDGKYSKQEYNASFIGFLPAENPQIVCFIAVSSPSLGKYGGQVAAPIFRNISQRLLDADLSIITESDKNKESENYLDGLFDEQKSNIPNNILKYSNLGAGNKQQIEKRNYRKNKMPNLANMSLRDAMSVLTELGVTYKIEGSGRVYEQSIPANQVLKKGSVCVIKCENPKLSGLKLN